MRNLFASVATPSLGTVLIVLASLGAIACSSDPDEVTVQLLEQDDSGQSGIATLRAKGTKTEVMIKVDPGPAANDPQPLHIHFGQCGSNLGGVSEPLNDLKSGESTTLLDANLASLMDDNHAINIHESYDDFTIYTSCGEVSAP